MIYESSAVMAIKLVNESRIPPPLAWEKAVKMEFLKSLSNQKKGCPRNTFLGLCEDGWINGIEAGKYTRSGLNKQYGITAITILVANKNKTFTPVELWKEVLKNLKADPTKQHNSQMNVVLALWNEGLIIK